MMRPALRRLVRAAALLSLCATVAASVRPAPFVFATVRYESGDWNSAPLVPTNVIHAVAQYTAIPVAPQGTVVDNPVGVAKAVNEKVGYSGDAISMYTHTGTHLDTLNHFGLHGKLWNGFTAQEHLGDRGWTKAGAEKVPPIVARGVLLDVATTKGVAILPDAYGITPQDLQDTLAKQGTTLQPGDVVLTRTGRMQVFYDKDANTYLLNSPGITLEAAKWLIDDRQAMAVGADNIGLEAISPLTPDNWVPVHTYLEAERGVTIIEVLDLEALSRDKVYEFVFIGAPLKLRGATGAPMRPLAIPMR